MKLLEGKTAIVTGAARGIGKEIALKYASEGCNIAFTDLVIDENGKKTEEEIAAYGVKCKGYASNAADFAATEKTVEEIKADFGSIDILVNNAGITKDGLMLRMTEQQWDAVIAVNLKSAFNYIHAVLDHDASEIRFHNKYGISGRCSWKCRTIELCRIQSRSDRPCQEYRAGGGLTRHPRKCHSSRLYRDSDD